jgi:16S rRNA (uracil1498-N3)-methyltransferase
VVLTDGRGLRADCRVTAVDHGQLELAVEARSEVPRAQPRLVVVQALPKGERGELAVEMMTEVGVDDVVPWAAARCVTQWKAERGDRALRRWRSTASEAAKQARRAWIPDVAPLHATSDVAQRLATAALAVVLHEAATRSLADVPVPDQGDVVVVVGPEGGITPEELRAFTDAGGSAVRLGPSVLRTSTAGTAAVAVLLSRTARWR